MSLDTLDLTVSQIFGTLYIDLTPSFGRILKMSSSSESSAAKRKKCSKCDFFGSKELFGLCSVCYKTLSKEEKLFAERTFNVSVTYIYLLVL
jgi:hypothetical protein